MKRKRLDRGAWWVHNKVAFPRYYQMRVDIEEFHGLVCLLQLIDGKPFYWDLPIAGKTAIIGKGMTWLQMIPDRKNQVLTAKYLPEGKVSLWYTDIIERLDYDPDGVAVFIDKYLDVVFTPQGDVEVADRDELDEALRFGDISQAQYDTALMECDAILGEYCANIPKTEALCDRILAHVNDRVNKGERQFRATDRPSCKKDMKLSRFSGPGIIATYQCNAACAHCCYSSSPSRESAYMSRDQAGRIFSLLRRAGVESCHIGGGEPFLNPLGLVEICRAAKAQGVAVEYIETNAGWACGDVDIEAVLRPLMEAGVDTLLISCDPFHIEYVPLDCLYRLARACDRLGMGYFVWQRQYLDKLSELDTSSVHSAEELAERFGSDYIAHAARAYGLSVNGRAIELFRGFTSRIPTEKLLEEPPCRGLTATSHFHVDPEGRYIPPGCIGFSLPLEDALGEISENKYPNYVTAAQIGLRGLYDRATKLGLIARDAYVNKCEFCMELKRFIAERSNAPDIGPTGFFKLD